LADRLTKIVEDYFSDLNRIHRIGSGTDERSYYPAVDKLLNAIGADLKGRVQCGRLHRHAARRPQDLGPSHQARRQWPRR
jgi:hypothetical protein